MKDFMSLGQVNSRLNILGQGGAATAARMARIPTPSPTAFAEPKLDISWGSFHQGIGSSLRAVLTWTRVPKNFLAASAFKDSWVEGRLPFRALLAAALWHFVFVVMPHPQFAPPRHYSAFDKTELTWSGPITDFPLVDMKSPKPKPSPTTASEKPLAREGADAFHPRQRIITDPVHPNHPRQTLINSAASPDAPKLLPNLPNVVQFQQSSGPARPRLEISKDTLAKLKPRQRKAAAVTEAPLPDVVANLEQKPAELPLAVSQNAPARPDLQLNAGAAPRIAQRQQTGEVDPAPEVGSTPSAVNGNPSTFIALSANPAPPAPVAPPQGNLAARVSISPEGKQPGTPGGSPNGSPTKGGAAANSGTGTSNMDVSITGGNPTKSTMSGLGPSPKISAPAPHPLITRPDPHVKDDDTPERTGPPNFAALPPGAQPEQIFASKKIYKMLVNMPNLNSATGSWILNFSELHMNADGAHTESSDVSAPSPLHKIDPKYPPDLIKDHVEGEVVLYAVIRSNGSVDSIQLVRGLDEQLDANSMKALSQWQFRPATKQGTPVDLEAIVHIPFHAPSDR
jgi:TonB family protein